MIIEVDAFKKLIVGYDPKNSEKFHTESAKLADKAFYAELKAGKYSEVVFLAGGAASGKTEFASVFLTDKSFLVYDGTMQNTTGFEIKLKYISKYQPDAKVKVFLVLPENINNAYKVFLGRERVMSNRTFIDTQIKSKQSVIEIIKNHQNIDVQFFTNFIGFSSASNGIFRETFPENNVQFLEELIADLKIQIPKLVT